MKGGFRLPKPAGPRKTHALHPSGRWGAPTARFKVSRMKALPADAILAALLAGGQAHASSSEWFEMEGARIRLVTASKPDADGRLRGILDIELKPGWKTYWRDPGDA